MTNQLVVRVPVAYLSAPECGVSGPSKNGWFSHLTHVPLISRPQSAGLAEVRAHDYQAGTAVVSCKPEIHRDHLAEIIVALCPRAVTRPAPQDDLLISMDPDELRWLLLATVPQAWIQQLPGALVEPLYEVDCWDRLARRLNRRRDSAGKTYPRTIRVETIECHEETMRRVAHGGSIDVALELDAGTIAKFAPALCAVTRTRHPATQVLRTHHDDARTRQTIERLIAATDLEEVCRTVYRGQAVPAVSARLPPSTAPGAAAPSTLRLAVNSENRQRQVLARHLQRVGAALGVEVEVHTVSFDALRNAGNFDASLLTVATTQTPNLPMFALTKHPDLPTASRSHHWACLVLGTTAPPISQLLAQWKRTARHLDMTGRA